VQFCSGSIGDNRRRHSILIRHPALWTPYPIQINSRSPMAHSDIATVLWLPAQPRIEARKTREDGLQPLPVLYRSAGKDHEQQHATFAGRSYPAPLGSPSRRGDERNQSNPGRPSIGKLSAAKIASEGSTPTQKPSLPSLASFPSRPDSDVINLRLGAIL
jgi:hypothetical protein